MAMLTFASFSSKPSAFSFVFAGIMLVTINALPFVFARIIWKAKDDLHDTDRVQKYGTLYKGLYIGDEGIENKRQHQAHQYTCVWMLRRTLFALITVVLYRHPGLQMAAH